MDNLRVIFNDLDDDHSGDISSEELLSFFQDNDRQVKRVVEIALLLHPSKFLLM